MNRYDLWKELNRLSEERYRFHGTEEEWRQHCKEMYFSGKSVGDDLKVIQQYLDKLDK